MLDYNKTYTIKRTTFSLVPGKIIKKTFGYFKVREHYLRDDLTCGSVMCSVCPDGPYSKKILEDKPYSNSDICLLPHYIIPDTNVIMHQIDILSEPVFKNVIILQTVIEELLHRYSPSFNKLKELLADPDRHFYTFINEHHRGTYVKRLPNESLNDRNDRAIRAAAKWYKEHLKDVRIIFVTNDIKCLDLALDDEICSCTFTEYVRRMKEYPDLFVKLYQIRNVECYGIEFVSRNPPIIFPEYWKPSEIQEGLKAGTLFQGKFQASRENYLEGFVFIDGEDESDSKSIFIQGEENINRAIDGYDVVIRILPEDEWTCPSSFVLEDTYKNIDDYKEFSVKKKKTYYNIIKKKKAVNYILKKKATNYIVTKKKSTNKVICGAVVGIINRLWTPYCGTLRPPTIKGIYCRFYIFIPSDPRLPKIKMFTKQGESLLSKRIAVSIDCWPRDSKFPHGHFNKVLRDIDENETENKVSLLEHETSHHSFSPNVMQCQPVVPSYVVDVVGDLRLFASNSTPECSNIDDTLHCQRLDNGTFEIPNVSVPGLTEETPPTKKQKT